MATTRIEVCPPEVWPSSLSWHGRVVRWLGQHARWLGHPDRPVNRLTAVKDEFLDSLADLQHPQASLIAERIAHARSLRELWHLRSPLYSAVSVGLSQFEAERRLSRLNRHFPTRAPRATSLGLDA